MSDRNHCQLWIPLVAGHHLTLQKAVHFPLNQHSYLLLLESLESDIASWGNSR
jgi:hypothetical protein